MVIDLIRATSFLALHVFGSFEEEKARKALEISLAGGTGNRANAALTTKTTKMAINGNQHAAIGTTCPGTEMETADE